MSKVNQRRALEAPKGEIAPLTPENLPDRLRTCFTMEYGKYQRGGANHRKDCLDAAKELEFSRERILELEKELNRLHDSVQKVFQGLTP